VQSLFVAAHHSFAHVTHDDAISYIVYQRELRLRNRRQAKPASLV